MSLSVTKVVTTVILSVVLGVAVHVFRSRSQQNFGFSRTEAPLRLCPICYKQFQTEQTSQKLPCGHVFHKECIGSVLEKQVSPSCPYCRKTFSPGEGAW